jgi:threonine synthase
LLSSDYFQRASYIGRKYLEIVMNMPGVQKNPYWTGYRCVLCGRDYDTDWRRFVCEACGTDGILDAVYDYETVAERVEAGHAFKAGGRPDIWRFAHLMPICPIAPHAAWSVGDTPLHMPHRLRAEMQQPTLLLKDDTLLPSCSLKDRASAMAIADAVRLGIDHIACASTGNAAASLSVLAARAGIDTTIFVPAAAPAAKLAQLELHGSKVIRVDGTYDEAFDLSIAQTLENGWYSRNCAYNPLLVEGKKTAAFEILYATEGHAPDAVFVPVGDGCIVSAIAKGFRELHEVGFADKVPVVFGVQAEGAAPLAKAWQAAGDKATTMKTRDVLEAIQPVTPKTIADSISVGIPRNRLKAWKNVAATAGRFMTVSDQEIKDAIRPHDRVVVMVTGHGLKDPLAAV